MAKIRSNRIVEGAKAAFKGDKKKLSASRKGVCNECPHKKNTPAQCGICHCFLDWKTRVPQEMCPTNRWEDVKEWSFMEGSEIYTGRGLGLRLHDPSKATLEVKGDIIIVTYNEPFIISKPFLITSPIQESELNFDLINNRSSRFEDNLKLTNIQLKGCNCTKKEIEDTELNDGRYTTMKLTYTHLVGKFETGIKVLTDQDTFYIKLKGEVKIDE